MKKILATVILLTVFTPASFGAVSGDVYVRQDVFDARMESLRTEIQLGDERILSEIRAMNAKFEAKFEALNQRIDDLKADTNNRIDDLKTVIYWGISIIGLMVAFAIFAPQLGEFLKNFHKPSVSLDEIEERMKNFVTESINQAIDSRLSSLR